MLRRIEDSRGKLNLVNCISVQLNLNTVVERLRFPPAQRYQLGRAEQHARLAVEQRLHHQLERPRVAVVVEVLDLLVKGG